MAAAIIGLIGSVLVGVLSLIGVIYTNAQSNKTVENQIVTAQAVTDNKIENLTREVKKHNDFASRIPVLENKIENLEEEVRELKEK
jgi:Zn-dependent M32 family carboxypeptidase